MIYSMTGYGRGQQTNRSRDILVEIKSVNHRFFEFSSRIPRAYGFLEEKLKNYVQGRVSRGKVDVSVAITTLDGSNVEVGVNRELARGYLNALRELAAEACRKKGWRLYMPPLALCGDNAAMIAAQGYYEWRAGNTAGMELNGRPYMEISDQFLP